MTSDLTISEEELEGVRHHLREHGWGEIGDEICALARRSLAAWQPIETAPDDRKVLLAGEWQSDQWEITVGEFSTGRWPFVGLRGRPSHWMPLPEPPGKESENETQTIEYDENNKIATPPTLAARLRQCATEPWGHEGWQDIAREAADYIESLEKQLTSVGANSVEDLEARHAAFESEVQKLEDKLRAYAEGRAAGLEEAAEICDGYATIEGIAQKCAADIRAAINRNQRRWQPIETAPSMAAETEETELGRIVPYSTQRYRATPVATQSEEKEDEGEEAKTQQAQAEGEEAQTEARKPATKEQHRIPGLGSVGSVAPLHIPQAERNDDDPNAEGSETCPQKDEQVQQGQEGVCSPNIGAGQQVAPPPPVKGEEFVVWNEPICLKPGFVANSVCRATKADIITAQKGNFPERNYSDQEALADFMAVHWAWFEPFPPSPPPVERGKPYPTKCPYCDEDYERGHHRTKEAEDNCPGKPLPPYSDVGELVERLLRWERLIGYEPPREAAAKLPLALLQDLREAAAKLQAQAQEIAQLAHDNMSLRKQASRDAEKLEQLRAERDRLIFQDTEYVKAVDQGSKELAAKVDRLEAECEQWADRHTAERERAERYRKALEQIQSGRDNKTISDHEFRRLAGHAVRHALRAEAALSDTKE